MIKVICALTLAILTTGCPPEWYNFINSLDASDLHLGGPSIYSAGSEGGLNGSSGGGSGGGNSGGGGGPGPGPTA